MRQRVRQIHGNLFRWIASMRDFNGVTVFFSIMCPRNFTRVKKKSDLSGASFIFLFFNI